MAWDVIDPRCGKPGWRWVGPSIPKETDRFLGLTCVAHINGRLVHPKEHCTCDSCGEKLPFGAFRLPQQGGVWVPVEPKATDWPAPEDAPWLKREGE
ncbi:MAG: hypothetical protein KGL39_05810 [Patescibacteria group bacterium]|nr:hypothetical protein [Patescibacteria group bacterium]